VSERKDTGPGGDYVSNVSRLGRFIEKYSSFLSSFVIGMAGLIATSIWQYRQSENARVEAETQGKLAQAKADTDWKIARAEILAKNFETLSKQGPGYTDSKFGLLLSLTRGNILDPELAVSYALELGKDNAYYMRSVLASTSQRSYQQLVQAFALTCIQRFGAERDVELCADDKVSERSDAIATLVADDLEAAASRGHLRQGPMGLLVREEDVQNMPGKLAWLFEPYLQDLYEHKRWSDIARFEGFSPGARLVAALVLATARTGELVAEQESQQLREFHLQRRRWLAQYLLGRGCDPDCRARLVEFMLSTVQESGGDYDEVLKAVLLRPRADVGRAVNHIHTRLLWCQIDPEDERQLRDRVILPAAERVLARPPQETPGDPLVRPDMVSLVALLAPPTEATARARYDRIMEGIRADAELTRQHAARQARAQRQRTSPPPMVRKVNFCGAAPAPDSAGL
jgi:hypothetical protein